MYKRIKLVREALHLSQREFGERLGVSRDVISNLEYNRVSPKGVLINHLCEVYGVNKNWLETGEGMMFESAPKLNKEAEDIIDLFIGLRPEFQECALNQMRQLVKLQESLKKPD